MAEEKLKLGIPGRYEERTVEVPEGDPRPWDADSRFTVVGTRASRLDGPAKVTGQAVYTHDVRLPDMLFGAYLTSPHPHALVKSVDSAAAEKMPGVKAVVLADDKHIRFAGQWVAAVAAETLEQAERACRALVVEYETRPFTVDLEEARLPGAPKVWENRESNVVPADPNRQGSRGDIDAGFAKAEVTLEATYRTQVQTHACMETHGMVAHWEAPDKLKVWSSTQGTFSVRDALVRRFELKADNVEVVTEHMGGGFGSKLGARDFEAACVALARKAGRPVHLMADRKFEHLSTGNRPSSVQIMKAGCTRDGKVTAWQVDIYGTGGTAGSAGATNPMAYDLPVVKKTHADVNIHAGPGCPMRAPGHPQGCFGMESMMDELAYAIGMDPVEFRRKNNTHPIRDAEFDVGMKAIGWERRNPTPGAGPGPLYRGIGVASGRWSNVGGGNHQVLVNIHPDGSVEIENGAQDLGTGTRTLLGMIAAEELGLPLSAISVKLGHTSSPVGPASGGSSTAPGLAPVARKAAFQARRRIFELVAPRLEVQPDQLVCREGKVSVAADPSRALEWNKACELIRNGKISELATRSRNFEGWQSEVAGVQFAEVEVDVETGRIRVLKVVAVQDCGTVLSRLTAESQVVGSVIQGVSYALFEDRLLDRNTGRMVNPNLESYKIAGSWDMPEIVPIMFDTAIGFNNAGVNGLGEPPAVPTAAAIANAVYNACGVRMRELPMTPWRVLAAVAEQKGGRS